MFKSKTRTISASRSCLAEHMVKFKRPFNWIWARFRNISLKLTRTQRKRQSQIDININSHRKMLFLLRTVTAAWKFFKTLLPWFWLPKKNYRPALIKSSKFLEASFHPLKLLFFSTIAASEYSLNSLKLVSFHYEYFKYVLLLRWDETTVLKTKRRKRMLCDVVRVRELVQRDVALAI